MSLHRGQVGAPQNPTVVQHHDLCAGGHGSDGRELQVPLSASMATTAGPLCICAVGRGGARARPPPAARELLASLGVLGHQGGYPLAFSDRVAHDGSQGPGPVGAKSLLMGSIAGGITDVPAGVFGAASLAVGIDRVRPVVPRALGSFWPVVVRAAVLDVIIARLGVLVALGECCICDGSGEPSGAVSGIFSRAPPERVGEVRRLMEQQSKLATMPPYDRIR